MGEWPALWNSWFATTHHDLGAAMRIMGGFELTVGQHNALPFYCGAVAVRIH